ncbi:hypothetical protein [Streptococcus suis]|uniref:hypothetical protein n=1 Tax=Streptococcus suis TaxID=1307 RepID=UPI000CF5799C|nr:hypothetical protein [Streptococcus suis]MCK3882110.1 hypothetical protein [Streptococcus suis]
MNKKIQKICFSSVIGAGLLLTIFLYTSGNASTRYDVVDAENFSLSVIREHHLQGASDDEINRFFDSFGGEEKVLLADEYGGITYTQVGADDSYLNTPQSITVGEARQILLDEND